MKAEDIRDMSDLEIQERISELKEERFKLRFRSATMELENPMLLGTLKRDIARLKTILHERRQTSTSAEEA
jgi:large subunit ribosomal protein L29